MKPDITYIVSSSTSGRSKILFLLAALLLGAVLAWASPRSGTGELSAEPVDLRLNLTIFATGLESPVGITNAGPGDDRLFVIEKAGRIRIVRADGSVAPTPFLDITDRVNSSANEQGLLGLTFHPDHVENGYFYVNYTYSAGPETWTRISRFQVSGNPDVAARDSEDVLLTVEQPYPNHNAGDIHFGPDGFLYIPLGDGGSGGDPDNNAQSTGTLLGKVVRIDVNSSDNGNPPDCVGEGSGNYIVPDTNPFLNEFGYCDEIWAQGLRNPWQSSFDRLTGNFYIGDVGQGAWEEVDFQPADSPGGENYGWRCYEGNHPYNTTGCEEQDHYEPPIFEYSNPLGDCASVIGGYVYRGTQFPALSGLYVLTDLCSGIFWTLDTGSGWQPTEHDYLGIRSFVAFGEDAVGELYVANINSGNIYRVGAIDSAALEIQAYLPFVTN